MKSFITALFSIIIYSITIAQHTFSIVAVDSATGEVGSAGASCLTGSSIDVSIISGIVPGKGAINTQATVCIPNLNLTNAMIWMKQGNSPQQILDSLLANDKCTSGNTSNRQYGIVDLDSITGSPRSVGYTGINCMNYKNHNTGYNYSIQGNILKGQEILDSMEANFLNTGGTLADKLMAALQGANVAGADSRCLTYGTSSTSAFIRVAKPTDTSVLFLEIKLGNLPSGKEPIDSLQIRFDQWKSLNTNYREYLPNHSFIKIFPNPVSKTVIFELENEIDFPCQLEIFNSLGGKIFSNKNINSLKTMVETETFPTGIYFYKFTISKGKIKSGQLIIE